MDDSQRNTGDAKLPTISNLQCIDQSLRINFEIIKKVSVTEEIDEKENKKEKNDKRFYDSNFYFGTFIFILIF